jgi:hypothetical protein
MPKIKAISKANYRVTIAGRSAFFTTFSGINETRGVSKYSDGQSNRSYSLPGGMTSLEDVTLTKPFDIEKDNDLVQQLSYLKNTDADNLNITITPVKSDVNGSTIGTVYTLYNCKITRLKFGELDRNSSDPSMLELSFSYDDWG